jgi:hypothetical protein
LLEDRRDQDLRDRGPRGQPNPRQSALQLVDQRVLRLERAGVVVRPDQSVGVIERPSGSFAPRLDLNDVRFRLEMDRNGPGGRSCGTPNTVRSKSECWVLTAAAQGAESESQIDRLFEFDCSSY